MDIPFKQAVCYTKGRGTDRPRAWCLHIMGGTFEGTDAWFQNPNSKASAHYAIAKDGRVRQYVRDEDFAWANGIRWSAGEPFDPAGVHLDFKKLASFVQDNRGVNPNDYTLSIEFEGYKGDVLTEAQYNIAAKLIAVKNAYWKIPNTSYHYIRHSQIDPVNRPSCPGLGADISRLINKVDNLMNPQALPEVAASLPEEVKLLYHVFQNGRDIYMTTVEEDFKTVAAWSRSIGSRIFLNNVWYESRDGDHFIFKRGDDFLDDFIAKAPTPHVSDIAIASELPDNAQPVGENPMEVQTLLTVTKEQIDQMVQDSMKPVMLNLTQLQQDNTTLRINLDTVTKERDDLKATITLINDKIADMQSQLNDVIKERDSYKSMVLQVHADNPVIVAHNRGEVIKYKAAKIFLALYKPDLFATIGGILVIWLGYIIDLVFNLSSVSDAQHIAIPGVAGIITYGALRAAAKIKATLVLKQVLDGEKLKQEAENEVRAYEMSIVEGAGMSSAAHTVSVTAATPQIYNP